MKNENEIKQKLNKIKEINKYEEDTSTAGHIFREGFIYGLEWVLQEDNQ